MTSPRPYAPQRGFPEAVAEPRRFAGGQFDPAVVDALAELVAEPDWSHARAATAGDAGAVRDPA